MRLIWKKRFGMLVVSYPVKPEGEKSPDPTESPAFRVGIYDTHGDLWWFSEKQSNDSKYLELQACKGWAELLNDFGRRHEFFPDGSSVLDAQPDIDNEIQITSIRQKELEDELHLPRSGSPSGQKKEQEVEKVHPTGVEENEGDSRGGDEEGESERDEPRKDSGSEPLDSEQSEEDDQGGTAEGNAGHSAAADQPEESDQEAGATA